MIRSYQNSDLDQLLDVWERASRLAHPFLEEAFMQESRQKIVEVYVPITKTWVWAEDGRVIGFISMLDNEVGGLFVDPEAHGRGIGTALLDHVKPMHSTLRLEVFKSNIKSRGFYAHYGFTLVEEAIHEETGFPILKLRYEIN